MSNNGLSTENVLGTIKDYLDYLDKYDPDRSKKTKYWMRDYINFQKKEIEISKNNKKGYKKYNRGDVIKVHLGFKIGREFGGLHYAIVIGDYNKRNNDTLVIVPLKSAKENISRTRKGEVFIGEEIYTRVLDKINETKLKINKSDELTHEHKTFQENMQKDIDSLSEEIKSVRIEQQNSILKTGTFDVDSISTKIDKIQNGINRLNNTLYADFYKYIFQLDEIGVIPKKIINEFNTYEDFLDKLKYNPMLKYIEDISKHLNRLNEHNNKLNIEINKLKKNGTIALVRQITTISKIRIFDPITEFDALSNITLDEKILNIIDKEVIKLYTNTVDI